MRIAMWSGPRNISTAMMYAFAARADCAVSDEPFYAAYLAATGIDHPMCAAVLASQPVDPSRVASTLIGPAPSGKPHWYQKHMVHHMRPGFMPDWPSDTRHVFLIRHPARVVESYAAKRGLPSATELGFVDQLRLFDDLAAQNPLVIDSETIRHDPDRALRALCGALELAYDPAMLRWPAGGNPADGVWAAHWYGAVHRSTGFADPEGPVPVLDGALGELAAAGRDAYARLRAQALLI